MGKVFLHQLKDNIYNRDPSYIERKVKIQKWKATTNLTYSTIESDLI